MHGRSYFAGLRYRALQFLAKSQGCFTTVLFLIFLQQIFDLIGLFVFEPLNAVYGQVFGINAMDAAGPLMMSLFFVGPMFLLLALPTLFFGLLLKYASPPEQSQKNLGAAQTAERGPKLCHQCEAPLEYEKEDFTLCLYCQAPNVFKSSFITDLMERFSPKTPNNVSREPKKRMGCFTWLTLGLQMIVFGGLGAITYAATAKVEKERFPRDWSEAIEARQGVTTKEQPVPLEGTAVEIKAENSESEEDWPGVKTDPRPSDGATALYLPLEKGQTLRIETPDSQVLVKAKFYLNRTTTTSSKELENLELKAEAPWSFETPIGAWYRLDMQLPAESTVKLQVRVE